MGNIINLDSIAEAQNKIRSKIQAVSEEMEARQTETKSDKAEKKKKPEVPIWRKANLTLEEAAAYTGIGINKLRTISNERDCEFVLFVGSKRLIKRQRLEEYLDKVNTI